MVPVPPLKVRTGKLHYEHPSLSLSLSLSHLFPSYPGFLRVCLSLSMLVCLSLSLSDYLSFSFSFLACSFFAYCARWGTGQECIGGEIRFLCQISVLCRIEDLCLPGPPGEEEES